MRLRAAHQPSSPAPRPSSTLATGHYAVTTLSSSFVTQRAYPHPLWHTVRVGSPFMAHRLTLCGKMG